MENCALFMCSIMSSQCIVDKAFQANISKTMKCVIQNGFLNSSNIHMHGGLYTQHCSKLNSFQFLYSLFFYHSLPFCISLYFLSFLMARVSRNLFKIIILQGIHLSTNSAHAILESTVTPACHNVCGKT